MLNELQATSISVERFSLLSELTLAALSDDISREDAGIVIGGIARFGHTGKGDLCFCDRDPGPEFGTVAAGTLVLCRHDLSDLLVQRFPEATFIPVGDPRSVFIDLCRQLMEREALAVSSLIPRPFGIHPTVRIGAQTWIHPETRIDQNVSIGAQCVIHRGSWIRAGTVIRDNAAIGVDGINAYRGADSILRNFPHLAGVLIGERSEIGAGTIVAAGILNSTRIGNETVIGNLNNIGHVVEIGDKVWMSVGCLIGGHTKIRDGATLGMGVAVRDNIDIGQGAQIGMGSVLVKNVKPGASMFGNPARVVAPIKAGPER